MAVRQTVSQATEKAKRPIVPRRSFAQYVVLSLLTCSVYHYVFLDSWVKDINVICKKDGEHTVGVGEMMLFSILTLGIYKYLWLARIVDRIYNNALYYDVDVRQDGNGFFTWVILIPFLGYYIAMYFAIRDSNRLAAAYSEEKSRNEQPLKSSAPQKHSLPLEQGMLIGLAGDISNSKISLVPGQKIVIGRDPSLASLVIDRAKISRVHCVIQYNGKQTGYTVIDRSRNGVRLNGKEIRYNLPTYASAGSIVALADGENKFQLM